VTVQLDIESLRRIIVRNCSQALISPGFDVAEDAPPVELSFAYGGDDDCVGVDISQPTPGATK
jgi:hypothetical protein